MSQLVNAREVIQSRIGVRLLTQSEVCAELRISRKTLQRYRNMGKIHFFNMGHRSVRIRATDLEEFVQRCKVDMVWHQAPAMSGNAHHDAFCRPLLFGVRRERQDGAR